VYIHFFVPLSKKRVRYGKLKAKKKCCFYVRCLSPFLINNTFVKQSSLKQFNPITQQCMKTKDIIFGIHPIAEAINSGKEIDRILLRKDLRSAAITDIIKAAKELQIPVLYVPVEKINRMTNQNHQGIIAFMSVVDYQDIANVLPMVYEKGEAPLILVLDRITDVRNFGAIARTAECAGVHAIIIPDKNSAQINADAIKTSSGAIHNIDICRSDNLVKTIRRLKSNGLQIVACTEKSDQMLYSVNLELPTAIIIGNEEEGISFELLREADTNAAIPLYGKTQSLNVSVATGIITYEAVRQRIK